MTKFEYTPTKMNNLSEYIFKKMKKFSFQNISV